VFIQVEDDVDKGGNNFQNRLNEYERLPGREKPGF
jgi:hypothetical protein